MESKRGWVAINRLKVKKTFGSIFPRDEKMIDAIAEADTEPCDARVIQPTGP